MDTEATAGTTVPLDTLVPISQFCRSSASREFAKVADGVPVTVLKNGGPAYVIITAHDYRELCEAKKCVAQRTGCGTDVSAAATGSTANATRERTCQS